MMLTCFSLRNAATARTGNVINETVQSTSLQNMLTLKYIEAVISSTHVFITTEVPLTPAITDSFKSEKGFITMKNTLPTNSGTIFINYQYITNQQPTLYISAIYFELES